MRMSRLSLVVLGLAVLLVACTSAPSATGARRGATRAAVRVDVAPDGRPSLDGVVLSVDALARRISREGAHRAVALHGGEGCTKATLLHLQRQLVRRGVPNVAVVMPRRASAEAREDPAGVPGAPGRGE